MKAPLGSRQAVDEALGAVGLVVAPDLVELLPGTGIRVMLGRFCISRPDYSDPMRRRAALPWSRAHDQKDRARPHNTI